MPTNDSENANPEISVIIVAYDYGRYIEAAIDSVLNQTVSPSAYEVIVVDDGSHDDTRERVAKYNQRVIYCYKDNGGQASAFNTGIRIAKGKFISFLDADDYWYPEKLEKVLNEFRESEHIDVVYHSLRLVDDQDKDLGVFPKTYSYIAKENPFGIFKEGRTPFGSTTSGLSFRTSVLVKLLPLPEDFKICADSYLMLAIQFLAHSFAVIEVPLACYRLHGANHWAMSQLAETAPTPQTKLSEINMLKMILHHLDRLTGDCNCVQHRTIMDLRLKIFCEEVYLAKQVKGYWVAVGMLLRGRHAFSAVKLSHKVFRIMDLSLHLLLPFNLYQKIRLSYVQSFLWGFVQTQIK